MEVNSKQKLSINVVLQTMYQVIMTIAPLLTTPYISRVLGADGLGVNSYSLSISNYFMMFAMLGVANYGCRSIAAVRDKKEELSKVFWNIYTMQFICSFVSVSIYYLLILIQKPDYYFVALVQGFYVISCIFDISWLFFGVEKFITTTIVGVAIKVLTVSSVFLFVRSGEWSVVIYASIVGGGTLVHQLILFVQLRKVVDWVKPEKKEVIKHIKPNLWLFLPCVAESIYHNMDKTMLGWLSTYEESGFYYAVDKLINVPKGIINALGAVFMSRISNLYGTNNKESAKKVLKSSFLLHSLVISALAFGIYSISREFIPLFFGEGYERCYDLMIPFCAILIIKSYTIFLITEYYIPSKQENKYTMAVCAGAVANLISNFVLIKPYGALGATYGTLIAEIVVFLVLFVIYIRKEMLELFVIVKGTPFYVFGLGMYFIVRIISNVSISSNAIVVVLEILIGAVFYIIISICYVFIAMKEAKSLVVSIFRTKKVSK